MNNRRTHITIRSITSAAALALALIAGSVTVAASSTKGDAATRPLIVNTSFPPATLDPAEVSGEGDFLIPSATYLTLVRYGTKSGPDGTKQVDYSKTVPYLAKSWTVSPDSGVYTFHLNPKFHFNDGSPITAADVAFSFERSVTMKGGGSFSVTDGNYTPPLIKSITATSPYTVVFTLNVPDSGLLTNWAQPTASVVEPSVVNAHGGVQALTLNTWMAGHIAGGGGPYVLSSYNPGVQAIFKANPRYPLPVKSKEVIVSFVTSPSTLALDARDGESDITLGIPNSAINGLKTVAGVKVPAYQAPESEFFGFNVKEAPSNNLDLRLALRYATPLKEILSKVAFGYGTLYQGEILPSMIGFNGDLSRPAPYDLAKAKAYMSQSHLTLPVSLTVDVASGDEAGAAIAPILQSYWAKVGVALTVQTLSPALYQTAVAGAGHTDQSFIRLAGPLVPRVVYFWGYDATCGSPYNRTQVCIPKADALLKQASLLAPSKQQTYWNRITVLDNRTAPQIAFYEADYPIVLNSRVHNYVFFVDFGYMDTWGF